MILEVDNVELSFGNKNILNGIYLKAETGKITGILGSNGCGKSSLLDIIFGNLKPKYKLVRIDKLPILKPLYQTKTVKYLPQHSILPKLKLKTIFKLFKVDWDEFCKNYTTFNKYYNTKANKLSGGEQRLVEIYLILKSDSKIVLLDEPFSHLAPLYIEQVKIMLQKEKSNKLIIITDHMYRHIIDSSDDIYLLKNGSTRSINAIKELEDYGYLSIGSIN